MKRTPIFLSLAVLLCTACLQEPLEIQDPVPDGAIALNIEGAIDQVPTRATAAGFVDGDALGLWAVNYSDGNSAPGTLADSGNQADNVQYVFDEHNWKWNPLKPVYYKDVNTNVDLYVYYPYQSSVGSVNAYGFEVQKDQARAETQTALSGYEASDLLWGKAENVAPSENKVKVTLRHRLAAAVVSLEEGTGFAEGEFALLEKAVLATGTTRKASVDFATGEVTPVGAAQVDGIVMATEEDGSFRAVVVPQTVAAGTPLFSITVAGVSYGFRRDEAVTYEAGRMARFTVRVSRKMPSGEYEFELTDTEILPWTEDRNTHGGEARQYYVVNVQEPGTLGQLIRADKKNPDKIRNLKVTGTVTTEDFYFMRDSMAILEAVNMKESRVVHAVVRGYPSESVIGETVTDDVIPDFAFWGKEALYYYVFPETVLIIGTNAFRGSNLSGHLSIPSSVIEICSEAFMSSSITGISFNNSLITIEGYAFSSCSKLSGSLLLPPSLKRIGQYAFSGANLSGPLVLPSNLESIGASAFSGSGSFSGDLSIPDKIKTIPERTFYETPFSGRLFLNNVIEVGPAAFKDCGLSGTLTLNDAMSTIPLSAFEGNSFTELQLPHFLRRIESLAFAKNPLLNPLIIPEGCVFIADKAFFKCKYIPEITFPSTLQTIQGAAFSNCMGVVKMICNSIEPPSVFSDAFEGIGRDNLTLEVPAQSVSRYQTTDVWSDFKRISAHYDFSLSRRLFRTLNASASRTMLLRAPAELSWSIESKPDWVTVSPDHGIGKTSVTVTVSEMPRTEEAFQSEFWKNGAFQYAKQYKGRSGEVVFLLNEKNYRFTLEVEQYDYDYGDGDAIVAQSSSKGNGIDLVFLGDGYDARDIADGTYVKHIQNAIAHFFAIEPYASYIDYFNAHIVFARSEENGLMSVNTVVENRFGSGFKLKINDVFVYAQMASIGMLRNSPVVLLANTSLYGGQTYLFGDGTSLSCCPVSQNPYPYDFRGIIQHEVGGHAFGKLGDEYIYHNAYADACPYCGDVTLAVRENKARGWYRNLELTGDWNQVGWSHLIFNPAYSDLVDVYEGGYMHSRHIWRSEPTSCMNNNIPYFSTISRQAIVERIMDYAGEEFTLDKFYANDSRAVGPATRGAPEIVSYGPMPDYPAPGHHHGPVFMGDHPNVK